MLNKIYRVRAFSRHGYLARDKWFDDINHAKQYGNYLYEVHNYDWIVTIDEYEHVKQEEVK